MSRSLQNVSFQSETDNRSNFPSNQSFHDFKKQRDKFYSLLRRWGEESRGPDYEFTQLAGEVPAPCSCSLLLLPAPAPCSCSLLSALYSLLFYPCSLLSAP